MRREFKRLVATSIPRAVRLRRFREEAATIAREISDRDPYNWRHYIDWLIADIPPEIAKDRPWLLACPPWPWDDAAFLDDDGYNRIDLVQTPETRNRRLTDEFAYVPDPDQLAWAYEELLLAPEAFGENPKGANSQVYHYGIQTWQWAGIKTYCERHPGKLEVTAKYAIIMQTRQTGANLKAHEDDLLERFSGTIGRILEPELEDYDEEQARKKIQERQEKAAEERGAIARAKKGRKKNEYERYRKRTRH